MSSTTRALAVLLVIVGVTVLGGLGKVDGAAVLATYAAVVGYGAGTTSGVVQAVRGGRHQEHA